MRAQPKQQRESLLSVSEAGTDMLLSCLLRCYVATLLRKTVDKCAGWPVEHKHVARRWCVAAGINDNWEGQIGMV